MLENQVLHRDIKEAYPVAIFDNDGLCGDIRAGQADELTVKLNKVGIKFAAVNHAPPIVIYVEAEDLKKVKEAGIKLPTEFDRR